MWSRGAEARKSAYADVSGLDAREIALEAVAERKPKTVLEVGCGEGEMAEQIASRLGVELVAIDLSPRMVELARARGLDARVADIQSLPFADDTFDVVLAAWMLYHVLDLDLDLDLDRGLAEVARVLRPGGALIAVTNAPDHLQELWELAGIERWELPFDGRNGDALLETHFSRVDRREAYGTVVFADIAAVKAYYGSSARLQLHSTALPDVLDAPLVARRKPLVFVAEKADA